MKRPTKFVKPLTAEQRTQLKEVMKSQAPQRRRMRAHAVLLSDRCYAIDQSADIYQVDRDRVSEWLDWWEEYQFEGLDDDPRSGRPPTLTAPEQEEALKLTLAEPRSLRQGLSQIATELGKTLSRDTLKRRLAAKDYIWKRLRRSLRSWRDEGEFQAVHAELAVLRRQARVPTRALDRWYFDEAGFTLQPCLPYAWQKIGTTLELTATHGPRQNIRGFLTLPQDFHCFAFPGTIDTRTVIHCFALFRKQVSRPALVVLDNAPIHTSEEFEAQIEYWRKRDLYLKFLPPYCPELNLIEILWRKINYQWLPLDAYRNFPTMTQALFEVLKGVGSKYRITFA